MYLDIILELSKKGGTKNDATNFIFYWLFASQFLDRVTGLRYWWLGRRQMYGWSAICTGHWLDMSHCFFGNRPALFARLSISSNAMGLLAKNEMS